MVADRATDVQQDPPHDPYLPEPRKDTESHLVDIGLQALRQGHWDMVQLGGALAHGKGAEP